VAPALTILAAPTPVAWVDAACERWRELLIDHSYCERKAASSALALIFAYPEDVQGSAALARLAREELRHFEQLLKLMRQLDVSFRRLQPGRYASGLRAALASREPARKIDLMLAAALIEARSCERFGLLAPRLSAPLGEFYSGLQAAEARHFELYLRMAQAACEPGVGAQPRPATPRRECGIDWRQRLAELAAVEAQLVTTPDAQFRFHSGLPQ